MLSRGHYGQAAYQWTLQGPNGRLKAGYSDDLGTRQALRYRIVSHTYGCHSLGAFRSPLGCIPMRPFLHAPLFLLAASLLFAALVASSAPSGAGRDAASRALLGIILISSQHLVALHRMYTVGAAFGLAAAMVSGAES